MDGFIKLHRQIMNNPIWYEKPDKWYKIWNYILFEVFYTDGTRFNMGSGYFKTKTIAQNTGATPKQVEGCVRWLREEGMVETKRGTRGLIVKVRNWEKYQTEREVKREHRGNTEGTQGELIREEGRKKKEENTTTGDVGILKSIPANKTSRADMNDVVGTRNSISKILPNWKRIQTPTKLREKRIKDAIKSFGKENTINAINKYAKTKNNTTEKRFIKNLETFFSLDSRNLGGISEFID